MLAINAFAESTRSGQQGTPGNANTVNTVVGIPSPNAAGNFINRRARLNPPRPPRNAGR